MMFLLLLMVMLTIVFLMVRQQLLSAAGLACHQRQTIAPSSLPTATARAHHRSLVVTRPLNAPLGFFTVAAAAAAANWTLIYRPSTMPTRPAARQARIKTNGYNDRVDISHTTRPTVMLFPRKQRLALSVELVMLTQHQQP